MVELWDRIFKATQDVVTLGDTLGDTAGQDVLRRELVMAAMQVGVQLVRAKTVEDERRSAAHWREARLKAIEVDYWLRLVYVLQRDDEVQRDLSSVIVQYTQIIASLQQMKVR